jgi:GTP-binding protein Era
MEMRSGFVSILGLPNDGKSTLSNQLVGERLSIVTPKAQTTRRRILGIVNEPGYQIIYTDNPGIIRDPEYRLQEWMNQQIAIALQDADIMIYMVSPGEKPDLESRVLKALYHTDLPVIILLNKSDEMDQEMVKAEAEEWGKAYPNRVVLPFSALHGAGLEELNRLVRGYLPIHPPYFDTDSLTDQQERFFVAEMIREKILMLYQQEIPYSVEVVIDSYKEKDDINVIRAIIYVARESQKIILIGKKGAAIKQLGTAARKDIEEWLGKKVFLELFVKVKGNWKDNENQLKQFGYQ